jgi:predicted ribosome quality control (RQC) complex YloA/Tae2 family protein
MRKNVKNWNQFINENDNYYNNEHSDVKSVVDDWCDKMDSSFFNDFIESYPSSDSFKNTVEELENQFDNFPGEDIWFDFHIDLKRVGW